MSVRLDNEELELLSGHGASALSHAAKLAYILGIRPHMDYATGIVGHKRKVSYQSLAELLEFSPVRGSQRKEQRFNREALRAIFRELERVGLIRWIKNEDRCLFFECLVAHRDSSPEMRSNPRTTPSSNPMNNPPKPSNGAGLIGIAQPHEPPTTIADEQPTSGSPGNTERERDAHARATTLPDCIPGEPWRLYEDERNRLTGRVMSISQQLALWQQLTVMDGEGYDVQAVLMHCVAHGLARFERRSEFMKKPPAATNLNPGARTSTQEMKRGNYGEIRDFDNSAVAKTRRACERWLHEQNRGADEPGGVLEGQFEAVTLHPAVAKNG